jgi:hypothetical protein
MQCTVYDVAVTRRLNAGELRKHIPPHDSKAATCAVHFRRGSVTEQICGRLIAAVPRLADHCKCQLLFQ